MNGKDKIVHGAQEIGASHLLKKSLGEWSVVGGRCWVVHIPGQDDIEYYMSLFKPMPLTQLTLLLQPNKRLANTKR